MNKFNFSRFLQYAQYDLTLNRAFYRNLAIITASFIVGITLLGFLIRWNMVREFDLMEGIPDFENAGIGGTVITILSFVGTMTCVFAGCVNHPLRNKQGRISTLTLPATNAEKITWHLLLMLVGGYLLCLACVVMADGVNALFSLMAGFPKEYIYSLTRAYCEAQFLVFRDTAMGTFSEVDSMFHDPDLLPTNVFYALSAFICVTSLWHLSAFVFGNSLKYRYNIIWTYLAIVALQFVLMILGIIFIMSLVTYASTHGVAFDHLSKKFIEGHERAFVWTCYWIGMAILTGTMVWMWVATWRRYKHAQLVDKWNK